ncbi:MAG: PfkB family carbohydrate kinase [Chloroflexota bacterium]
MRDIEYLVIGHVARDLTPAGPVAGGTVTYAGRTAVALGCRTAALTSVAPDFDLAWALPDLRVHSVAAAHTTTFENVYTPHGRRQTLHARAQSLTAADVPAAWERAPIVHLGPIANEIDVEMISLFSNSLVGMTPQGWLRRWNGEGHVYATEWPAAPDVLPLAAAVILSEEDLLNQTMLDDYRRWSRLLVLTQGPRGCTVFCRDDVRQFPAPKVTQVEPTGAGDIFAAAFLIRLYQTAGNPWEAAVFANQIASHSVTQKRLEDKIRIHR